MAVLTEEWRCVHKAAWRSNLISLMGFPFRPAAAYVSRLCYIFGSYPKAFNAEDRLQYQVRLCKVPNWERGTEAVFTLTAVFFHCIHDQYHIYGPIKGKAIPITGLCGPEGSGWLRLQITRHSAREGGKVATLTHRPPLPPGWVDPRAHGNVSCHRMNSKRHRLESIPGPTDL